MNFVKGIVKELLERKLWPVAVLLIAALVAVPILLSKQAPTDLLVQKPLNLPPISSGTALPAISVQATPSSSKLTGKGRNPFTPQEVATTTTSTTPTAPTTGSAGAGTGSTAGTGSGGTGSAGAPSAGAPATSPSTSVPAPATTPASPSPTPTAPAVTKPAPTGLTDTQAYDVAMSITTPAGGVNTVDPLERLSVLPSAQQPLVVELGVLQGAHNVLFAVQRGTVVSGPGTCTPGPIDCEVLSLAPGQTEGLSVQTSTGVISDALFAVTAITARNYPTAAAADQARRKTSPDGRNQLGNSALNVLSLFQYQPNVGALVDLRTLTVGGS